MGSAMFAPVVYVFWALLLAFVSLCGRASAFATKRLSDLAPAFLDCFQILLCAADELAIHELQGKTLLQQGSCHVFWPDQPAERIMPSEAGLWMWCRPLKFKTHGAKQGMQSIPLKHILSLLKPWQLSCLLQTSSNVAGWLTDCHGIQYCNRSSMLAAYDVHPSQGGCGATAAGLQQAACIRYQRPLRP